MIELNNVSFAYPELESHKVLDIAQWSIEPREQVFVHGPSGCGKSTLLNVLSGMLQCSSGEVAVLGQRLDQMSARARDKFRAQHIGYVFQNFNLIPYLNAVENIQLASHFSNKAAKADVARDINGLLDGLNISASDRIKPTLSLSVGQQQRVAIARAIINKPELLIADEPTSSLDQKNRDAFMQLLMEMTAEFKIATVFVSHDMSLSHYFGRVDELPRINKARAGM